MKDIFTLGIETSCDETSAAVLKNEREILSNIISTQIPIHQKFGGVVPEIASRNHILNIMPVINKALKNADVELHQLTQIAVTDRPGLIGALLVGTSTAKALSYGLNIPIIFVNHLEGHIFANFLNNPELEPPFLSLIVSGGHTILISVNDYNNFEILGKSRDDAAGEAFDKIARIIGLAYPGGPKIEELAEQGSSDAIKFPHPKVTGYDFSFSGLKSAVLNFVNSSKMKNIELNFADVAASFQKIVIESLIEKTLAAANDFNFKKIVLAGGVAANSLLETVFYERCKENGLKLFYPPKNLCTDNAAMIACRGYYQLQKI